MYFRDLAWSGRPVGRLVTWWSCRRGELSDADLSLLAGVMQRGGDAAARRWALARAERLWSAGPAHRAGVWRAVWAEIRRDRAGCISWQLDRPPAPITFILGADPDSPHAPAIRLVSGMSLDPEYRFGQERPAAALAVELALWGDPAERDGIGRALTTTDEPHLLSALEAAFVAGLRRPADLWHADGTPTPRLTLILANPNLPRPADARTDPALAVLMTLRGRYDLLAGFDAGRLVRSLVSLLHDDLSAPVVAALRHVLRSFGRGPASDVVCGWAMNGDAEALAAAVDAEYGPTDPLFLVLTKQWGRFLDVDPTGQALHGHGIDMIDPVTGLLPIHRLLELLDDGSGDLPDAVRQACLRLLRDLPPGPRRDVLCAKAAEGGATATRVIAETGAVPSDAAKVPAFLALTGQWDRYDTADPDGTALRAYAEALPLWHAERDELREAARRAGRPMPCTPRQERSSSYDRPGGSGLAGTGGYTAHV